jgi:WD40 repeat protein
MEDLKKLSPPKRQLLIFVSSTFLDTNRERNILHAKILPDLQKKAILQDIQVILYDMRFGVKDENTLDHMTWISCRDAIDQCYEGSDGLFFLSLQADRYGYLPLPKYLDQETFLNAKSGQETTESNSEAIQLLEKWYILDKNHCPPRYELKNLRSLDDSTYWKHVLPCLRDSVLDSVAFDRLQALPDENLLINRSVTEWETLYGFSLDKERCYWLQRPFNKDALRAFKDHPSCWKLTDRYSNPSSAMKLEILTTKMKGYMKPYQQIELSPDLITPENYCNEENPDSCVEYLKEWERVTRCCLETELEKIIFQQKEWKDSNELKFGIPIDHLEEIFHHCQMAEDKARHFFGREELLESAKKMISIQTRNSNEILSGIDLALIGKSGCGKTALMSKLALADNSSFAADEKHIPTIIRFCGTSKFSLTGIKLLQSICLQILIAHRVTKDELKQRLSTFPDQDYKGAVQLFQRLISKYPIFLFIDSLDQLENVYEERSQLSFLREIRPHNHSRIIVSSLPDEYDENGKPGKYFYQCEMTLITNRVPILEVGMMDQSEQIQFTMKSLLHARKRSLTDDQWAVTLAAVSHEPTVLYINLAMEVICQWKSFEKESFLKPTVKGLIHQIFDELEKSYGKEFTSIAFAMITFSRAGVNDLEMQNLLSLHEGVLNEVFQYSTLHCFPMHVWLRLKGVIKNLVAEKESHCIKWYHRQLWETASERYYDKEKQCHEIMGRYFCNLVPENTKKLKEIYEQFLVLNGTSVWNPSSIVNSRRVIEGSYHLIHAGLYNDAMTELCSLESVCASGVCGDLFNFLNQLLELYTIYGKREEKTLQRLDHFSRWIRRNALTILSNSRAMTLFTAGEQPTISEVKKTLLQFLERSNTSDSSKEIDWGCYNMLIFHGKESFDALEIDIPGHLDVITCVHWNHDNSKLISASKDRTVKIWNAKSGALLKTLEGHTADVTTVAWNPDGSKILSGAEDGTIKLWDGNTTGELLQTLKVGAEVTSVAWSHQSSENNRLIVASKQKELQIWDLNNVEIVMRIDSQSDLVSTVVCNPVSHQIAAITVTYEIQEIIAKSHKPFVKTKTTIKIWDEITGNLLQLLQGHSGIVAAIAWNHDGSQLASGGQDKTIKIWYAGAGEVAMEWSTNLMSCLSWSCDDRRIVSSSEDKSIKVWDVAQKGKLCNTFEGHSESVNWVAWDNNSSENKIVSCSSDNTIKIWNGSATMTRMTHNGSVGSVTWNPLNKKIISGSDDGTIKLWDGRTGDLIQTIDKAHSHFITSLVWHPLGETFASSSWDKSIKIWNGTTGENLKTIEEAHRKEITIVAWNHKGNQLLSSSWDCTLKIWDALSGEVIQTIVDSKNAITTGAWNHSDSQIASGARNGSLKIWDAVSGMLLMTMKGHSGLVTSIAWNHNDTQVISASEDKTIKMWEAISGDLLKTLTGHKDVITSLIWNDKNNRAASASYDKTIKIWDTEKGELLSSLTGHSKGVLSVAWILEKEGGNEYRIVSGAEDKSVRLWYTVRS